ncbi:MAG TPA: MEDS domain-containing protein [Myxococcales bacterium]|nr:MEDS domain-containing protein [Myxococcales bacterium]
MAVDPANLRSIAPPERHAVQFYERDEFLCDAVADFLAAGLRAGDPVIAIATEAHRREFSQRLEACGIDLEEAEASGRLVLLDAADTLSTITVDGAPDWELFRTRIGGLIASKRERFGGARVRAYGEMVDLLWKSGNPQAAIRLEEMWSDLGRDLHFSLLCAYAMGNFLKEADGAGFEKICRVHTHVVPAEGYSDGDDPAARLRTIGVLQQRALALESEIEHRKELETALRAALDDRRRAEEELRKSREELRLQNEELSRAVRLSEMFIGILGHDLRNPLSAIVTGASLLYRRAESEKISKPALRILSSAERIWRMIDQILDFTRIRLGHGIPLQRRRIDLAEVCRLAIDEVESLAGEGRIRLEESGESLGVWDGDRLAQLVSNLLGNALAHGKGGTPVVIALDGTDPDEFLLEVHNAGAIPGDILPVLFDPFRGSNHKHERSSGLGLGLFISQQIVRAHGGNIEVSSSEEDGTRFLIRLPRNAPMLTSAFDGRDKG